jgi:uncharacterized membrane protein
MSAEPTAMNAKGRRSRFALLLVTVAMIGAAVYFLVRGAWWVSATLAVLWLAVELYGEYRRRRKLALKKRQPNA